MRVISTAAPVARKTHRCDGCGATIAAGTRYQKDFMVDGGESYTYRAHLDCVTAMMIAAQHGIEDDEGAWLNLQDFEPEDRDLIRRHDEELAQRIWPHLQPPPEEDTKS